MLVGTPSAEAEVGGAARASSGGPAASGGGGCVAPFRPHRLIGLKLVGERLIMYRTDGSAFPEAAELERDPNPSSEPITTPAAAPSPAKPPTPSRSARGRVQSF